MKYSKIYYLFSCVSVLLLLFSCTDDNKVFSDIKVGKEEKSLEKVLVNIGSERNIILSGGNGKYAVNIANSKIADVKISYDTLKIKGLYRGETFATITSHNQKKKLNISVDPVEVSVSQDFILLYPTQESRIISLSGGDIVDLEVNDPDNVVDVKWNGNTGILEMFAHYEGDATIIAKSENQPDKELKIKVRAQGKVSEVGIYDVTSRYIYPLISPTLVVKRKNVGVWLSSSTKPHGIVVDGYTRRTFKFSPIKNPKKGQYIDVNVSMYPAKDYGGIRQGVNRFHVEEVNESTIILKTNKVSKIILPYEK